ncbi:hypothetical protein [Streptomyces sp. NPDC006551]|uniref:hypothetical protein n=1 Tax=Streptomyces sp. NPDC006551 TaxID=3157178 RepID=UPI0033AF7AF3
MSQAIEQEVRQTSEDLARSLSWLGPLEQDEIARRFADQHLALRLRMLRSTLDRAAELRAEYSHRYDMLRRRTVALALGTVALAVAATAWIAMRG